MKTIEELNTLKEELESLNKKLAELTEEELEQITGGLIPFPGTFGSPILTPPWRKEETKK